MRLSHNIEDELDIGKLNSLKKLNKFRTKYSLCYFIIYN